MLLWGRCRCGEILSFVPTPFGYKRVCPGCGAVVRLNPQLKEAISPPAGKASGSKGGAPRSPTVSLRCVCGQQIQVGRDQPPLSVRCPGCGISLELPSVLIGSLIKRGKEISSGPSVDISSSELGELAQELSTFSSPSGQEGSRPLRHAAQKSGRSGTKGIKARGPKTDRGSGRARNPQPPSQKDAPGPVADSGMANARGWEQGARLCRACGQLLPMGSNVCRYCGYREIAG